METNTFFEEEARARGYRFVAGLDEAGRGPLAGPVVGAAVILARRFFSPGLDDSKQVKESDRERLYESIIWQALAWGIGFANEREIDALNIVEATRLALTRAVHSLSLVPDYLLVDALELPSLQMPQRSVVKGDCLSISISAASILAKVTRDRLMCEYHERFPLYQFHLHKGYPTPKHLQLLAEFGPCEAHRRSYGPVSAKIQ